MAAEDYFLRGQAWVRIGEKEWGILLWRQALGRGVNHVETLVAMEQVFFELDLLNEAAWAAERLLAQPDWQARADLMLGRIRAEQSDPAGAAACLQRALAHPDQWYGADRPDRVRKQLSRLLLQTGRPVLARDALRPLLRAGPPAIPKPRSATPSAIARSISKCEPRSVTRPTRPSSTTPSARATGA
jgi:hypothetical protein